MEIQIIYKVNLIYFFLPDIVKAEVSVLSPRVAFKKTVTLWKFSGQICDGFDSHKKNCGVSRSTAVTFATSIIATDF